MRIKDLLEQTVVPQPPSSGGQLPTTQPTTQPKQDSQNNTNTSTLATTTMPDVKTQGTIAAQQQELDNLKQQLSALKNIMDQQAKVLTP